MPFTFNVGDHVEVSGPLGSLEGTRGRVVEVKLVEYGGREAFEWVTMAVDTPVLCDGSELTTFSHDSEYFELIRGNGNRPVPKKRRLTQKQNPLVCDGV